MTKDVKKSSFPSGEESSLCNKKDDRGRKGKRARGLKTKLKGSSCSNGCDPAEQEKGIQNSGKVEGSGLSRGNVIR